MKRIFAYAIFFICYSANADSDQSINFAFGGATTNTVNATGMVTPILDNLAGRVGLELIGVSQQIDFAEAVLTNIDEDDVFWLWAGTNNILIAADSGNAESVLAATELEVVMNRLYNIGARRFVIPNLMQLGNVPKFNRNANTRAFVNDLTAQHNSALAQMVDRFRTEHQDALVIELDVNALFLQLEQSGEFSNTTNACFFHGLPRGIPCQQYLYVDDVHFSSAAAAKVAELAMTELGYLEIDRLLILGDSFSDTGSFSDTIKRSVGFGFPFFPFWQGRFSDGPNVIDYLEQDLDLPTNIQAFPQPVREKIAQGSNRINKQMIIPATLSVKNESRFGIIRLDIDGQSNCVYLPDWQPDGRRKLSFCSQDLTPGQVRQVNDIYFAAPQSSGLVSMDVFVY